MTPTSAGGVPHSLPQMSQIRKQRSVSSRASALRYPCDAIGCSSTFARPYDVVRHKKTIHGPKAQCPHLGCGYATARDDKMKEHCTKKHSASPITERSWRKSQLSSLNPENLSPSLGYRIANPGYLEACYNNSTFEFSGSGLTSPPWLRGGSGTTKDKAVNAPYIGWELNNPSFGTTKVGSITPLHTELGISSPSLELGGPGYMEIRTTHSIFETACLTSGSTLDWDQATWKLNEDELC